MLENALVAGITSLGVDVLIIGPLPTPGVAYITRALRADAGIVLSASHNSYEDNGIKFFRHDGYKLDDQVETQIEDLVFTGKIDNIRPTAGKIGRAKRIDDALGRYVEFAKRSFPRDMSLEGMRVAVDVANGAAYKSTPCILRELGAKVAIVHNEPNGININDGCGSTHPALDAVIQIVRTHRIEPDDVSQIDAWIHARRLEHTNRPDPQSALEAKFSLQYCVARALMHSRVVLEYFEGNFFRDLDVRRIMQRVRVQPYTEAQFDADNHFGSEVKITMVNGQTYSAKVQNALGRTSSNPLPQERLRKKFEDCAGRVLSPEHVEKVYASIGDLEQFGSMRELMLMIATEVTSTNTIRSSF